MIEIGRSALFALSEEVIERVRRVRFADSYR